MCRRSSYRRGSSRLCPYLPQCCVWAVVLLLAVAAESRADNISWRNSMGGTFSNAGNWFGGAVPDGNDYAFFGLSGGPFGLPNYTVSFNATATNLGLVIPDDRVTFNLNSLIYETTQFDAVTIATTGSASLTVFGGILIAPFQSELAVGAAAGATGSLVVLNGGLIIGDPSLEVGVVGTGMLTIQDGGIISDRTHIGFLENSTGTATITGAGSALVAVEVFVGNSGTGTLNVTAGGDVDNNGDAWIGNSAGAVGTATVADPLSKWDITGDLTVGNFAQGTPTITGGTLNIMGGGAVENTNGIVGKQPGSTGTANVDGTGSQWINSGDLSVGGSGQGTLNITAGSLVQSTFGTVGSAINSSGHVTVSGANSRWISSDRLFIGNGFGQGILDILAGGRVECQGDKTVLGDGTFGNGTVNVDGALGNSEWINAGQLVIGSEGTGTVNILAGGRVESNGGAVAQSPGSEGVVNVDGASQWISSDFLAVGSGGVGTLNITAGSLVESPRGSIGHGPNSNGHVTVSGDNSRWISSGRLFIGDGFGHGTLNISDGGRVESTGDSALGDFNGVGTVNVDGDLSIWRVNSGRLDVGFDGTGTLNITAGGRVSTTDAVIGLRVGSVGDVMVSGADLNGVSSTWDIDGRLGVGGDPVSGANGGTGTLRINPGGTVSIAQDTVIFDGDHLQLAGGTLSTTAISFNGGSFFSWTSGTLHVGVYNGSISVPSGGNLAPGNSIGQTVITGNYEQIAGGTLEIEIGDPISADLVNTVGTASLAGNLQLKLLDGFIPSPSSSYTIFRSIGISDAFANVANGQRLVTADGLGSFFVHYGAASSFEPTQIVLSNFLAALPGDYNQNGTVDAADYTVWRNNLGSGTALPNDDTPGVDANDYTRWKTHFGEGSAGSGAGSGSGATAAVPEPATFSLVALSALSLVVICRRLLSVRRPLSAHFASELALDRRTM